MTIRFLSSAGIPTEIYAVEVDGKTYTTAEVEMIIAAAVALSAAAMVDDIGHQCEAEDAILAALGSNEEKPTACAICRTPITQKSRGRRRKYCEGCVERLGHQAPAPVSQENARKKP